MSKIKKFGSIGLGNMGGAIVRGAVRSGVVLSADVGICDHKEDTRAACAKDGYTVFDTVTETYENTEVLLLAIKPQGFKVLLEQLAECKNAPENQIIVSIAAGITTDYIQKYLGTDKKIIRVTPNTPLLIGEGATALSRTENVSDSEFDMVMNIFGKMGDVVVIRENQMDEIIPANGSAPAFVYYFIRALADSCEHMGIERELAIKLLCKTFIGSAKMVLETGDSLDQLIKNVCSPKGATLEAIKVFDDSDLGGIIERGAINCVNRAKELGPK